MLLPIVLFSCALTTAQGASELEAAPRTVLQADTPSVVVRSWWTIDSVDDRGRRPLRPDAVFERYLLEPGTRTPTLGETLSGERGAERTWKAVEVGEDGSVPRCSYAYAVVEADATHVRMARLAGAWTLFVNGDAFAGDAYRYGFGGVPIELREGRNEIFVTGVRGGLRLELVRPATRIVVGTWDVTAPDLVAGSELRQFDPLAVPIFNASNREVQGLGLRVATLATDEAAAALQLGRALEQRVPSFRIVPLGLEKPILPLLREGVDPLPADPARLRLAFEVSALDGTGGGADEEHSHDGEAVRASVEVTVRAESDARRHVFRSQVDGSLQRLAARAATDPSAEPRLLLSLHGAGVDSRRQVTSYAPKDDFWVVAPTNRRPYGFDWQDWGRSDFYEALALARELSGVRGQVYLSGHSMGGHGTWHVAANDPELFTAIAPSAAWESFDTYGSRPDGALRELWHAADGASLTRELLGNLAELPTFILHGESDSSVPVAEGRRMHAALTELGADARLHVEPGKGHWWSLGRSGGADCLDWPEFFELFRALEPEQAPPAKEDWSWTSVDPAVDSSHRGVHLVQPELYGAPVRVSCVRDREARSIALETENVAWLWIASLRDPLSSATLDGETFADLPADPSFRRTGDGWVLGTDEGRPAYAEGEKNPAHSGPFKRAFDQRFVLVYGTAGSPDETHTLLTRARYDLQQWWYRANATVPLISDREWLDPQFASAWRARNVILYGNADTNAAWDVALGPDCPIRAERGKLTFGDETYTGTDLGAVFVRPRADGLQRYARALVGVFADTGVPGARLGYTLAPFVSGVGYPDYTVFGADVLTRGDGGVLAAGWWAADWSPQSEFAHRRERDEER